MRLDFTVMLWFQEQITRCSLECDFLGGRGKQDEFYKKTKNFQELSKIRSDHKPFPPLTIRQLV